MIRTFYFGSPGARLYGIHAAPEHSQRKCAVVLCYPMGQEYLQSHRAFARIAGLLASHGFHALRFDFFGCGDSEGACEEGSISRWLSDVSTAIGEVRARSNCTQVCLVGRRLGASLSMLSGIERGDVSAMALWDPVILGTAYLEDLRVIHRELLSAVPEEGELLGFALSPTLRSELARIDLLATRGAPADRMLLIQTAGTPEDRELCRRLIDVAPALDYRRFPNGRSLIADFNSGVYRLVRGPAVSAIVSWLSEMKW